MSNLAQQQWTRQLPSPAGAYGVAVQPAPDQLAQTAGTGGRGFVARAFFGTLWAVVFFVVGGLVMGGVVTAGITDPHLRDQAAQHAGQTWGVWLFLGSIGLAILLGSLGILPGTRRKTRQA